MDSSEAAVAAATESEPREQPAGAVEDDRCCGPRGMRKLMPPIVRVSAGAAACGNEVRETKAEEDDGTGTSDGTEALPASELPNTRDERAHADDGPEEEPDDESGALIG